MLKRFVSALCQRFPANEGAGKRQHSCICNAQHVSNSHAQQHSQAISSASSSSASTAASNSSTFVSRKASTIKRKSSSSRKSRKSSAKHYKPNKAYKAIAHGCVAPTKASKFSAKASKHRDHAVVVLRATAADAVQASDSHKLVESRLARAVKHDVEQQLEISTSSACMNFGGESCKASTAANAAAVAAADAAAAAAVGAQKSASVAGKWLKVSMYAAMMGCAAVIASSCSTSEDLPEHEQLVEDPVSFEVEGISGELNSNVKAHLGALAVIPKKRAVFYVREIKEVTAKALRAYGYYHPKIKVVLPDAKNKNDTTVKVQVEQGKPLYIRQSKIEILGEGVKYKVFDDLLKDTKLGSYNILNHGVYEDLKNAIHTTALSMGFFDGKFTSKRILVYQDQNFADVELIYDSGKRYTFGELMMSDETEELYQPSRPLQNFEQGQKFNTKTINSFVSSLNQTGYYNAVDVRPVVDKAHDFQVPVEMHLERRPNNNMRVGLGYTTDEGARVLLEWNKPLLNSRGDSLSTLATLTQVSQDAQIVYKIPRDNPNLDYYTINLAQTHTDFNDTLSDRSQIAFHYIANETGNWRRDYALRVEYEDFNQADEEGYALNFMPAVMFSRRESSGGYDPKRGYSLSLEALGTPGGISDNTFMQVKATYKGVIALSENTRFLFRLEQGANFGPDADDVPPSLRFFAGGDNSIRGFGYRDRSAMQPWGGLKGSKYLTTGSAEFQFPIGIANSRLALFCDAGTSTDDYKDEIMYGPGIGYRFLSPYGIVRVDIAVGLQKDQDNVYQLHFAFGPEF